MSNKNTDQVENAILQNITNIPNALNPAEKEKIAKIFNCTGKGKPLPSRFYKKHNGYADGRNHTRESLGDFKSIYSSNDQKIFWELFKEILTNSFALWNSTQKNSTLTFLNYVQQLVNQLFDKLKPASKKQKQTGGDLEEFLMRNDIGNLNNLLTNEENQLDLHTLLQMDNSDIEKLKISPLKLSVKLKTAIENEKTKKNKK